MKALSPDGFEAELRATCDRAYARQPDADNPMLRLLRGQLSRSAALTFWLARWDGVLLLNSVILPRLLERCPDLDSRVRLWSTIYPEYGYGKLEAAHPSLNRRLLLALGASPEQCQPVLDRQKALVAEQVRAIDQMSWLELLGRFLARETVGPKVFPLIQTALAEQFGLSSHELAFFAVHSDQDQHDADCVFSIAARHATIEEQQRCLLHGLGAYFEREVVYCCALGPISYKYQRSHAVGVAQIV